MKRTTKKVETFEYKCFQCLKQDDKARCYTRSYDLILHTVNTHRKFPVDARHNTYYAADRSDLRDATAEEVEKYRLAASHKRRKPESSCDKSESATVMNDLRKTETIRAPKSEEKRKSGHSSREKEDEDHRKCENKRTASRGSKDERTASRGSKEERTASRGSKDEGETSKESKNERTTSRDSQRGRDTGHRGSGDSASGRSTKRDKQVIRDSTTGIDDDEGDRRKLAEIIKRMDERKLIKDFDVRRNAATGPVKIVNVPSTKVHSEREESGEMSKKGAKKLTESQDATKRSATVKQDTTVVRAKAAGAAQRDEARRWAVSETSDSELVTQSSVSKSSGRQNGAKKVSEKVSEAVVEDAQSLEIQNFVASQYPVIDEGVSSTVRLGRALVSGALGKRNDDPKLLGAAINLVKCSVRIQTTQKKAKVPVSAAPPNSINSEVDCGDTCDAHLSQSATDLGTQIELPGDELEVVEPQVTKIPNPEIASKAGGHIGDELSEVPLSTQAGSESITTPRKVILADFNRLMAEIEASSLVQEELIRTEPQLASTASFLSILSGGPGVSLERKQCRAR